MVVPGGFTGPATGIPVPQIRVIGVRRNSAINSLTVTLRRGPRAPKTFFLKPKGRHSFVPAEHLKRTGRSLYFFIENFNNPILL